MQDQDTQMLLLTQYLAFQRSWVINFGRQAVLHAALSEGATAESAQEFADQCQTWDEFAGGLRDWVSTAEQDRWTLKRKSAPPRMTLVPPLLHTPSDMQEAQRRYRANDGPASLAAILKTEVSRAMQLFLPGWKGHADPADMAQAIARSKTPSHPTRRTRLDEDPEGAVKGSRLLPHHGLAFIQMAGPWESRTPKEAFLHTQWIGVTTVGDWHWFYDATADDGRGAWLDWRSWARGVRAGLLARHKATGWWVRAGMEIPRK